MKLKLSTAALCLVSALHTSPASAADEMQNITVQVTDGIQEVAGVACTLTNKFGVWHLNAPAAVSVQQSADNMVIDCKKDGAYGRQVLNPKLEGKWCWNVAKCGGIGFVFNDRTGAGYAYPERAYVELHPSTGETKR